MSTLGTNDGSTCSIPSRLLHQHRPQWGWGTLGGSFPEGLEVIRILQFLWHHAVGAHIPMLTRDGLLVSYVTAQKFYRAHSQGPANFMPSDHAESGLALGGSDQCILGIRHGLQ